MKETKTWREVEYQLGPYRGSTTIEVGEHEHLNNAAVIARAKENVRRVLGSLLAGHSDDGKWTVIR